MLAIIGTVLVMLASFLAVLGSGWTALALLSTGLWLVMHSA
jgi:hypothetical protein